MPFGCDHKAASDPIATSVQCNTVPSLLRENVSQCCKITIATYTTLHPEASPAAITTGVSNNVKSKELFNRDPHAGSDLVRFDRILGEAILNFFRTLPYTLPSVRQKERERLEFDKFPNPSTFTYWKINISSEVFSGCCHTSHAMIWVNEIDSATSMAELRTFESPLRHHFLHLERSMRRSRML